MQVNSLMAIAAAFFLCVTGCHVGGFGADGCGHGGCGPLNSGCTNGTCGGLVGLLPGADCGPQCATPETLNYDGYGTRGGTVGPLAGQFGKHHRGPQSHLGSFPGPADGPATPSVTYPYYTTRAPRDFFVDDPPSIGR